MRIYKVLNLTSVRDLRLLEGHRAKGWRIESGGNKDFVLVSRKVDGVAKDPKQVIADYCGVKLNPVSVHGFKFDGEKDGEKVYIFPFWKFKDAAISDQTLMEIAAIVGGKVDRVRVLAPHIFFETFMDEVRFNDVDFKLHKLPAPLIQKLADEDASDKEDFAKVKSVAKRLAHYCQPITACILLSRFVGDEDLAQSFIRCRKDLEETGSVYRFTMMHFAEAILKLDMATRHLAPDSDSVLSDILFSQELVKN